MSVVVVEKMKTQDYTQPKYLRYYFYELLGVPTAEYEEMVQTKSNMLKKIWLDSGCKDFSVYQHKDYIWDMAKCYKTRSRPTIQSMIRLIDMERVDSVLDYYNGIGLSTIYLKTLFPNKEIAYFNDVKAQVKFMEDYNKRYRIGAQVESMEKKKYDVVLLSEVFEHYENPEAFFIEKIEQRVGKYLVHSSPFTDVNIGHFSVYNGVASKAYTRKFHHFLESRGFEFVADGFNAIPKIYKNTKI